MMTTTNRVLFAVFLFAGLFFIACEEPVDCPDHPEPSAEPVLISYFDGLEQVLYYAADHLEQIEADPHISEWGMSGARYEGFTLLGEPQTYTVGLVPVSLVELSEISQEKFICYANILKDIHPDEASGLPAPSRRHIYMTCGTSTRNFKTCENDSDTTSVERVYLSVRYCGDSNSEEDSCTEFYAKLYSEVSYNAVDCSDGDGAATGLKEHKVWQCL